MAETTIDNNSVEHEVEETLEKTNLGHMINENKNLILTLGAILLAVIVGVSIYKSQAKKSLDAELQTLYKFRSGALADFQQKKINSDAFVKKFNALDAKAQANAGYIGLAVASADALISQNDTTTAIAILEGALEKLNANSYSFQLVSHQLATLYEDAGRADDAIATLEKMITGKYKILLSKVYFDLGRLYLAKGDLNKAKNNFEYVVNGFSKDKLSDYSKLYLQEIEKRAKSSN